jgi:hypothetical protein
MSNGENHRAPLGLPPGSVRGILSLLIVGQFWLLLLLPDANKVPIPINLYMLLSLVALFFVSHGKSIATRSDPTPSPLHLPGGALRFIIVGGTIAVIAYLYSNHEDWLMDRLKLDPAQISLWPQIVSAYVGGFGIGYIMRHLPIRHFWGFQAFQAWLAMIVLGLLVVEIVIQAFINASLKDKLDLRTWEAVVTGVAAYYFGVRS